MIYNSWITKNTRELHVSDTTTEWTQLVSISVYRTYKSAHLRVHTFLCKCGCACVQASGSINSSVLLPTVRMSQQRNVGHAQAAIRSTKLAQKKSVILTHFLLEHGRSNSRTDRWRRNVILAEPGILFSSSRGRSLHHHYPSLSLLHMLSFLTTNTWSPDDCKDSTAEGSQAVQMTLITII